MPVGELEPIAAEEKRAALKEVLASETLSRSAQLRKFLGYVCETAIAGHTDEINEYAIGVEALGRQPGYSLAEDSAVRSRAYELRQRLEKYYATENPGAAIRISIPKGSYVPVFTRRGTETPEPAAEARPIPWKRVALVQAVVLTAGALWIAWLLRREPAQAGHASSEVRQAWGPLASPGIDDALVCVATKMHLLVRPNLPRESTELRFPAFSELYPLFRRHRPLPAEEKLQMEPADSSVAFGEVSAIATVARTLSGFGKSYQILPERIAPLAALRDRNAVVIGIPMDSDVVSKLLSTTVYTIAFHPAVDELAIIDRRRPNTVPEYAARATKQERVNIVYGLVTVLPSEGQPESRRRTVVFSGLGSVGTHGAADFFSSAEHVGQLRQLFAREGISGFPKSYQVLVRCKLSDGLLLSTECVHAVVLSR